MSLHILNTRDKVILSLSHHSSLFSATLFFSLWKFSLYDRSLGPFSGLMLCCEDSQGSAYGHTQSCDLLRWKDIEQNQQSEKNMGQNLGETKCKLPESPPSGVTQHALNFPDNKLWKPVWIAALSGVAESVFICLFLSRMVDINVFVDGAWH